MTHAFDPGFTGMSVTCNQLVDREGFGVDCGEQRDAEIHRLYEIAKRLRAGLSYDPITVSIAGHPEIRETFRTVSDADRVADELAVVADALIAEAIEKDRKERDGAICWDTTCLNCSNLLDSLYALDCKLDRAREALR